MPEDLDPRDLPTRMPRSGEHAGGSGSDPTVRRPEGTGVDPTVVPSTSPAPPTAVPGDFGRYLVRQELGRGGMGVVYRALDRTLGREVALKVLRGGGDDDPDTLERFQREARAAASLDHPNIVRVHDVGALPNGAPFFTMEMLTGRDLAHAIADGQVAPREAVEAVRQVALALVYAHQRGILHRDIKPQNLFLREEPVVGSAADAPSVPSIEPSEIHALLLDFGLAKLAERDLAGHAEGSAGRKSLQSLTRSGEIFGTPAYMPPEQTRGAKDVDARADIYSLGAALYHALAGRPPFDAASLADLLEKVQERDPSPPSAFNAEVDADLDTVCLKCLQKDPKDRYQAAADLAEDCRRWLAGDPIAARPIGPAGRLWRKARRHRAVAIPLAALSMLVLLGLATLVGVYARDRWTMRSALAGTRDLLEDGDASGALARVKEAQLLAPESEDVKALVARIYVSMGRVAFQEYLRRRADVDRLEAAIEETQVRQHEAAATATPYSERLVEMFDGWGRDREVWEARRLRGEAWSSAVVAFTESLTHCEEAEARRTLAELYWDEYLQAEEDRQVADVQRLRPLVKSGGKEFEDRLRGERDVRVRFRLPASFRGEGFDAFLFEYRPCRNPPVLVPVPFDVNQGKALQDAVSDLTEAPSEWLPVPLSVLRPGEARGESLANRVDGVRWGSVFRLTRAEASRVRIVANGDGEGAWERRLPKGSYLLWIPSGQGLYETRYPIEVALDHDWKESCDLASEAEVPPVPPGVETGTDASRYWVYLAPGLCRVGGDPDAFLIPPRGSAVLRVPEDASPGQAASAGTDGAWMARFEVTGRMYAAFVEDREWHTRCEPRCGPRDHLPRATRRGTQESAYWGVDPSGRVDMRGWEDWPVLSISSVDASDYCRWMTERHGRGVWRIDLPTENEWERAARGADGRYFPWGDAFHVTFCRMFDSRPEEPSLSCEPFGLFPIDESPFGVRDLAGGVQEATSTTWKGDREWRILKGGAWDMTGAYTRNAGRTSFDPLDPLQDLGFRLTVRRASR